MRRYLFLLIAIALLLTAALPTIASGRFTFAFDMGRDLLWVRNMVELQKPTLIGPWGSIAGVYFGPLWYYLLALPYLVFNGDPRGAVLVPLLGNIITLTIGWWWLTQEKHPLAANLFALLFAVSSLAISTSSFAFHANLLPLTTLLFVIGLWYLDQSPAAGRRSLPGLPLAALATSLSYHLEPVAAVMMTAWLLLWTTWKLKSLPRLEKNRSLTRWLGYSVTLFALPFLPQLVFELRHRFIQIKSLLAYFSGQNSSLGGVLPLSSRATERISKLANAFTQSTFPVEPVWAKSLLLGLFLTAILITLKRSKKKTQFTDYGLRITVYFIFFHYLTYTFLFPAELKGWYLYGFVIIYLIPAALILETIWQRRNLRQSVTPTALAAGIFLIIITAKNLSASAKRINFYRLTPPGSGTAAAQLQAVDWIYQDALKSSLPFAVYSYTPPIYDYQFQYLIWWRGTSVYRLLPAEFSYLPGETTYLPQKEQFLSSKWQPNEAKITYLIIEPEPIKSRINGWLGHFAHLSLNERRAFASGITVEKRNGS